MGFFTFFTFCALLKSLLFHPKPRFPKTPRRYIFFNFKLFGNGILHDSRGKYVIPECEGYGARQSRALRNRMESHYFPILYFNER